MKKTIRLFFVGVVSCLMSTSLFAQTLEDAANLYRNSTDFVKAKDYVSALSELQKCMDMCDVLATPESTDLKATASNLAFQCNYAYSNELVREKKYEEALPLLQKVETLALQEQATGSSAEEYITEVLRKIKINKSSIYAKQAKDSYDAGNFDAAIKLANQSIQEKSDNTTAFFYRGRAYEKKGDLNKMEEDFIQCINLTKDDPTAANINTSVKKSARSAYIKESQKYIQAAQKCTKEQESTKIENLEKALSVLKNAEKYDSDANTYYHLSLIYNGLKNYQEALKAANAGLPLETKNQSNFYFMIGQAYEGLGDIEKACANYKMVRDGSYVKPAGFQRDQVLKCKD